MIIRGVFYELTASRPPEPDTCWAYYRLDSKPADAVSQYTVCRARVRPGKLTCEAHDAWEKAAQAKAYSDAHFDLDKFLDLHKNRRRYERMIRSGKTSKNFFGGDPQQHLDRVNKLIEEERAKPEIPTAAVRQRVVEHARDAQRAIAHAAAPRDKSERKRKRKA